MIKEMAKLRAYLLTKAAQPDRAAAKRRLEYLVTVGGLGPRKRKAVMEVIWTLRQLGT
jgi:hypothetical protein